MEEGRRGKSEGKRRGKLKAKRGWRREIGGRGEERRNRRKRGEGERKKLCKTATSKSVSY